MSNISSDTRAIAERMTPWDPSQITYSIGEIPDWEYLRVHAIRLSMTFDGVYLDLGAAYRDNDRLKRGLSTIQCAYFGEACTKLAKYVLDGGEINDL